MKTIRVETDIEASVETVWAELVAISEFADWNPFITQLDGELAVGNRVAVRILPPGGRAMSFRPTITVLDDCKRLEWLGRVVLPGVFDGRHSFTLAALADGRTRLTQMEQFSGALVPFTGAILKRTAAGFAAMNEALRLRAEVATVAATSL